jgi:hypothetical protein
VGKTLGMPGGIGVAGMVLILLSSVMWILPLYIVMKLPIAPGGFIERAPGLFHFAMEEVNILTFLKMVEIC